MTASQQIIEVLNDLCMKFGIAIDWSSENVIPYLQDFCGRFIQYNVIGSIIWCVFPIPIIALCIVWFACSKKSMISGYRIIDDEMVMFALIALIGSILISMAIWTVQAFHIAECCTIPEKAIIDYIQRLID